MYLHETQNFNLHSKEKMSKTLKGISIIKKVSKSLPRYSLVTIYKSFVRPHLDYSNIIYDQPNNESFTQKIEKIQYNAALAITGAIKGVGLGSCVLFLKLRQLTNQNTYLTLFQKLNL